MTLEKTILSYLEEKRAYDYAKKYPPRTGKSWYLIHKMDDIAASNVLYSDYRIRNLRMLSQLFSR